MTLYITKNNQRLGPYPLEEAQRLLASGQIQWNDLAWYEGLPQWIPLNQVPGLATTPPLPAGIGAVPPHAPLAGPDSTLWLRRGATALGLFAFLYVVLFLVFFIAAMFIGGAISGAEASATAHAQGFNEGYSVGAEAGRRFSQEYARPILAIDALATLLLAGIISLWISFSNLLPWCRRR